MISSTAPKNEFSKMTALKLTIFTPTQITTASHYATIDVGKAANVPEQIDTSCVRLDAAMRLRHNKKRKNGRMLSNRGDGTAAPNWRIPFPTNDNMPPRRA